MPDDKNLFEFGTGSIKRDQWLRDIDNEQDAFISRYSNAVNKHRATLLRQAFTDLRDRIARGDMLNRTADGNYQFGSALNREDKHMEEAYRRALGFMGELARRQINTPAKEPEKKAIGSLEERYIKSLNPSGKFNTEAYWKNQTDEERRTALKDFLNRELKEADNYQDFGNFGNKDTYTQRLQTVMNLLESGKANDWSLQQLGFTKNWLTQPTQEEPEEKKSELEQVQSDIAAAQEAQQVQQGRQFLAFNGNRGRQEFNFGTPQFDLNYQLQHLLTTPQEAGGGPGFAPSGPSSDILQRAATSKYISDLQNQLDLYFKNFATSWRPNYESGEANQKVMRDFLSKLFSTYSKGTNADGTPASDYAFDWKKYFTQIGQNQFLINGSIDNQTGRYAYYIPGEGIKEDNILDNPNQFVAQKLGYTIPSQKEGGKVEFLQSGGGFDYDAWKASQETPKAQVISKPQQTTAPKQEGSSFSTAENARIAATIADIASMGAAFVPGYGTAASAVLGLGSTATNFGADLADGQGLWNATKNAGFGLAADVMGLIPGLGGVGKGAKIARNLMWAVPKMMQWVNTYQGLQNAGEIKNSIMKLTSPSSMTVQDWQNVSQALQIMTGHGRSVATKVKKAGMSKTTTTTEPEHYIFTNKGKQKVSDETFKRLREARGTKARQTLTQELMGEGVTLQQTRFAPWNTSTRFGAFKQTPGKTTVEVQNKHKGWLSDENLVEKVENMNPSVDMRSIMHRVNPYRDYYNRRNQPVIPQRNYSSFEARLNGEASPLNVRGPLQPYPTGEAYAAPKAKRKPLTDQQKAARKQKAADKKSKEQAKKQLEELRRNQGYALAEEIPQAGTYAGIKQRQQTIANLSSRYANEVELPIPTPRPAPGPRSEAFNKKYGKAIGKKEIGGVLKALRNGGIIKAQGGLRVPSQNSNYDFDSKFYNQWVDLNWGNPSDVKATLKGYSTGGSSYRSINGLPEKGGEGKRYENTEGQQDFMSAYQEQQNYYNKDQGSHIFGDVKNYYINHWLPKNQGKSIDDFIIEYNKNVDKLRENAPRKLTSTANIDKDWGDYNRLFNQMYANYSPYSQGLEDTFGESTWRRTPNTFNGLNDRENLRHGLLDDKNKDSGIIINNDGKLVRPEVESNNNGVIENTGTNQIAEAEKSDEQKAKDKLSGDKTIFDPKFENPKDPTLPLILGQAALGLIGNRNVYKNLLEEMPQAVLRDRIDRQLAIVGWQERIKHGQNQLADLRKIQQMQRGSDQQTNFATALEVERNGRDITDKAFQEDSGRQFETAQKLWNLKNEDRMYNIGVGDYNRKAIAARQEQIAKIRAAWRNGDNNILMGAASDTANWLLKKYQREQDLVDRAREISLGTPEERAQASLSDDDKYTRIMNKYTAGQTLTDEERAYIRQKQAEAIKGIRGKYAKSYYDLYHTPYFGGGFKEDVVPLHKNGSKLEIAKLRARSKDNDRYVSMIRDLRKSSRRRRRRFYYDD